MYIIMRHLNIVKGGFLIHKGEIKPLHSLKKQSENSSPIEHFEKLILHDSDNEEEHKKKHLKKHTKTIKPLSYKF